MTIKSTKSPAFIDCVTSYEYVAVSAPLKSFEYSAVDEPYTILNKIPSSPLPPIAGSLTLPVIRALPVAEAVQRNTAPAVGPGWNPLLQIPRYVCDGFSHKLDPALYDNRFPAVSR